MKTASPTLTTFLNTARQAIQFDLWTFILPSGTVVRWTDADLDIKVDTRTFTRGPVIARDRVKWVRGIEADQCKVGLFGPTVLVDGKALPVFAAAGGFDGSSATLERVYMNDAGVVQGSLVWFVGAVADVFPTRMGCEVVLKSPLTQLSQQLPRNLYQAGCLNDLYDSNCAAKRAAFTVTGSVMSAGTGYNPGITVTLLSPMVARYAELGTLQFTSGANAGLSRTVQRQPQAGVTQTFYFARPFPFAIAVGDTINVSAGCDKSLISCQNKFANVVRFRGMPFVPVPETVT